MFNDCKGDAESRGECEITYLAGVEWWRIEMEGDRPVAVAGVLDPVQAQLIAHVSHLILKNVLLFLNFAGAILVLGFVGPVIPRLDFKKGAN